MVMVTTDIDLFRILRQKFGDDEAEALVQFVDSRIKDQEAGFARKDDIRNFATKEDLKDAKLDMIKWMFGFFFTLFLMIIGLYFKK